MSIFIANNIAVWTALLCIGISVELLKLDCKWVFFSLLRMLIGLMFSL